METKLYNFIHSDLLNKYVVGETNTLETAEVEYFISNYTEAAEAYQTLQNNLEILARADAIDAPSHILDTVLKTIETQAAPKVIHMVSERKTHWYSLIASVAAVTFAVTSFFLYQKNKNLNDENNIVIEEIYDLRSDIEKNNSQLNDLSREFMKLNNPDAKKYVLTGNERAKNLKTVAYINPVDKTSMIDVISLPQLPEEQYYQIWAELQDRMVNLGILDKADHKLTAIPYMEDALTLSITIETKGIQKLESNTEVAEISLKDK